MNIFLNNREHMKLEVVMDTVEQSKGVFVIIGGSGNIDKNGNNRMFKMNIYSDISSILHSLGFSVLRYSKRGTGKSDGTHNKTGLQDLLNDLEDVVTYVTEHYPDKKLYLLGHSEGAMIATLFSDKHQVDGMVLISGAGIGLKDALQIQNQYLSEEIQTLKGLKGKLLRRLLNERKINKQQSKIFTRVQQSKKDIIRVQLVPIAAKWMREHFEYESNDYLELLQNTTIRTLVLQGTKDAHTALDFVDSIQALENPNITVSVMQDVDHILRDFSGEVSILNIKKQYKKEVKKNISERFISELEMWVR